MKLLLGGLVLVATVACGSTGSDDGLDTHAAWWSVHEPATDGSTELELLILIGSSNCDELAELGVDESSSHVRVDAVVRNVSTGPCNMDSTAERATVELDAPLGDRQLRGCSPEDAEADCRSVDDQLHQRPWEHLEPEG